MVALPHIDSLLELAHVRVPQTVMAHQVTFPIYRAEQVAELGNMLVKIGVAPVQARFSPEGLQMSFANDEEATLAKMSFDGV